MILNAEQPVRRPKINKAMTITERNLLWHACKHGKAYARGTARIASGRLKDRGFVTLDLEVLPDAVRGRHQIRFILYPTQAGRDAMESLKAEKEIVECIKNPPAETG